MGTFERGLGRSSHTPERVSERQGLRFGDRGTQFTPWLSNCFGFDLLLQEVEMFIRFAQPILMQNSTLKARPILIFVVLCSYV